MQVSLLLLTYNNLPDVVRCFDSLRPVICRPDVECIVLDNGSTDGTTDYLTILDNITLISGTENLGVGRGRSLLIEKATGDILVFLDSDVFATSNNWLDQLLKPLERDDVGLVGCAGSFVDWQYFHPFKPAPVGECDVVSGWCQAFKRELIHYGLALDHDYGLFFEEDSDFCMQVQALGWEVYNVASIGLRHVPSNSGAKLVDRNQTLQRFRDKWMGKGLTHAEG